MNQDEIEVETKLIFQKEFKLKTITNNVIDTIINILECEQPYVIVVVFTIINKDKNKKNNSFRIDIYENDLSNEMNQWLRGKIIYHPCYIASHTINDVMNNFIKYQVIPKQEHLLLWILSRIEISIEDQDNIAYFGGITTETTNYNKNINNGNERIDYNTTIINNNNQNKKSITFNDSINNNSKLNKLNTLKPLTNSTYQLTNKLIGNSNALNSLKHSKVSGREGAKVATKPLTTSQYVIGADIEYTRKEIEKAMEERRKQITIANIRKKQQIEKYNIIKSKLNELKNNLSWDAQAYNELLTLQKTKEEIERDIVRQRIKAQKDTQMIAWTKAPPGFSNLRGKSMQGAVIGDGPLPFDATSNEIDPRLESTMKKYYWDESGRRHVVEHLVDDEESLIDKAFKAIKIVARNASAYKLNLKEVFDAFDSSGDGYLTIDEVGEAFLALGVPLDIETLNVLFNHFDSNGSGSVNYGEFLWAFFNRRSLARKYKHETKNLTNNEILSIFHRYDINGDGSLNKKEFTKLLNHFNIKLDSNQLDILINRYDKNQDGDIDIYEFKNFIDYEVQLLDKTKTNPLTNSKSMNTLSSDKIMSNSNKKIEKNLEDKKRNSINESIDLNKLASTEIIGTSDKLSIENTVWLSQLFQAQASIESKLLDYYHDSN